jgi:curved DNA-binding protein CbpA
MSPTRSPYEILGVPKDASAADIRKAYRKLAALYHPDNKDTGNDERFKELSDAHAVVGNPARRATYDEFGITNDLHAQVIKNCQDCFVEAVMVTDEGCSPLTAAYAKVRETLKGVLAKIEGTEMAEKRLTEALKRLKPAKPDQAAAHGSLHEALTAELQSILSQRTKLRFTQKILDEMLKYFNTCTYSEAGLQPRSRKMSVSDWVGHNFPTVEFRYGP